MSAAAADWPDDDPAPDAGAGLLLDLDGFEGPIDLLLALARDQKVDLARISILQLADQYLAFIERRRVLRLEIAADYLVMAAWLAYLKSRLLLPQEERPEEQPSAEELAEGLAFQLRRLEAMKDAAVRLLARPKLGEEVFPRGAPEGAEIVVRPVYSLSLFELLKAYADRRRAAEAPAALTVGSAGLFSIDAAIERFERMLGRLPDWQTLQAFLPPGLRAGLPARSALASTLVAALELTRTGRLQLRQERSFGPIYLRPSGGAAEE